MQLSLIVFSFLPLLAAARPLDAPLLAFVPGHAAILAYDAENSTIVAYDTSGSLIGRVPPKHTRNFEPAEIGKRYDQSVCANISGSDIQSMAGYQTIANAAIQMFGDGWAQLDTNDAAQDFEINDGPTYACVNGVTHILFDGQPSCSSSSQTMSGSNVGTDGTLSLQASEGTSASTTITVTNEAAFQAGVTLSATVGISDLLDLNTEFTTSFTFTNSQSMSQQVQTQQQSTQTLTINTKSGQTCNVVFEQQTCDVQGHGQVQMTGHGFLWFRYPNKRTYNGETHWWWALSLDYYIPDESQRSTYVNIATGTTSSTNGNYTAVCTGGDDASSSSTAQFIATRLV